MPRDAREILAEDKIRLMHMLESARRAVRIAAGLNEKSLEADEIRLLATVKSIEVIGEAATKVSEATSRRLPEIPWRNIRDARNRMVHGYDTIDASIVWRTVVDSLPLLIAALERALFKWPVE